MEIQIQRKHDVLVIFLERKTSFFETGKLVSFYKFVYTAGRVTYGEKIWSF